MTAPLAKTLRAHARRPYDLKLSVGRGSIQRLRKLLGLDHRVWDDMRLDWWMERIEDLATLPVPEFVAKHGAEPWTRSGTLSEARVWQMRVALLGRRRRPAGWWRIPPVLALLQGKLPQDVVAKRLHITPVRVGELRRKLRHEPRAHRPRGTAARRKRPGIHGRTPRGR